MNIEKKRQKRLGRVISTNTVLCRQWEITRIFGRSRVLLLARVKKFFLLFFRQAVVTTIGDLVEDGIYFILRNRW